MAVSYTHLDVYKRQHQTRAKYEAGKNEFEEVGLTAEFLENIPAPFVLESRVKYALSLEEVIPIKLNDTFLVIGKLISVFVNEAIVSADGFLHLDQVESVCSLSLIHI